MLCLHGQLDRFLLVKIIPGPQVTEQVKPEISSERLFNNLPVSLAGTGSPDPHGAQHLFVDRQGRTGLGHISIIAS